MIITDLIRHDKKFFLGIFILLIAFILSAITLITEYDPTTVDSILKDIPPGQEFLFGTNSLGQDLFWRMSFAIKNSLILGILMGIFNIIMGATVGLISGYFGGLIDRSLSTIADTFIVIPSLPVIIFISFLLRDHLSFPLLAFILALFSWPWVARQTRSLILSLRERQFTFTSIFSGNNPFKVIMTQHFPFVISFLIAHFINSIQSAMSTEIVLSVFGLSRVDIPTIGTMIYWANQYQALLLGLWWWVLNPVIVSILLFYALYLTSVSISNFLDPRTRLLRIEVNQGKP